MKEEIETIFANAFEEVKKGAKFKIDFENRSMKINGKLVLKDNETDCKTSNKSELCTVLTLIEPMFVIYQHSIPGTDDEKHTYFKALKYGELTNDDMTYGISRNIARYQLESYILASILEGNLYWDEELMGDGWFWQSNKYNQLVILRSWIERA